MIFSKTANRNYLTRQRTNCLRFFRGDFGYCYAHSADDIVFNNIVETALRAGLGQIFLHQSCAILNHGNHQISTSQRYCRRDLGGH